MDGGSGADSMAGGDFVADDNTADTVDGGNDLDTDVKHNEVLDTFFNFP